MAVFVTLYTVTVCIAELIAAIGVSCTSSTGDTKTTTAYTSVTMGGGQAFNTLAFGRVAIAAGAISV